MGTEAYPQLPMKAAALLKPVVWLPPLVDGSFSADAAFELVVGGAAGDVSLEVSTGLIARYLVRR
ncbi:hypothetical protein ACFVTM_09405 [Arthrobacter sp. NPDC058130]|uniref:hypothetical protein n=1 Tax=Arthrobacter sp. NPDC058130 TaxID=3346353 RepID=UPI0036E5FE02